MYITIGLYYSILQLHSDLFQSLFCHCHRSIGISPDFILKSGWTGLMHAANYGRLATVAALTERGANVNFHKGIVW